MIRLVRPGIFSEEAKVTALFTEANRELSHKKAVIPGLDFGMNTATKKSTVQKNYRQLEHLAGIKPGQIALASQIHGSTVATVDKPGLYPETDGLVTGRRGLALAIQVADCAAVLAADSKNGVAGAFHAGWRGAVAGILPNGMNAMRSIGAEPARMSVYLGPCISQVHFEVGEEVARQFPDSYCDTSTYNKPHVDLKSFLVDQLVRAGIKKDNIEVSGDCTVADKRYYSYRRDGEQAGRMAAMIMLNR